MAATEGFLSNGVTAHRGDSTHCPENTMAAFERGLACGSDWLELDVHTTRDGQLVVCHDHTTGRTGSMDLTIASSTLAELQAVDMAFVFRAAKGNVVPPARIPRLRDVLALVMSQTRARVSIQPKSECIADVVRLVEAMGAESWIGFNDGDVGKLREARECLPSVPIFYDTGPGIQSIDGAVETALRYSFQSIVMHSSTVTPDAVQAVRGAGLESGVWTVNDAGEMGRLLDGGIHRFYTDAPELLLALLREREIRRLW